ncbi:MAG: alpha/beta hydrolase [Colwellia sp.]|nr:alpha/beta hydrolase [Colwellia sp.]
MSLSCIEVLTGKNPTATIIWLHGLGADGRDFDAIVPELKLDPSLAIRFIFPNAARIPVTVNGGMIMPAWYDILDMSIDRKVDTKQLNQSAIDIIALVEKEIARGIPSEKIILAGFSQGGAVVYQAALTYHKPLAGLLAMSTYLATSETRKLADSNAKLPIMIMHGSQDPVVPEALGQFANKFFIDKGYKCQYKVYPMQHSVCAEQITDISCWINNTLMS